MKNIESKYVKDVTTSIYGCPEIRSKYTGDYRRQISTSFYHQLCNYLAWEVGMGSYVGSDSSHEWMYWGNI